MCYALDGCSTHSSKQRKFTFLYRNIQSNIQNIKGIVSDWSDTEKKGLEQVIGIEQAQRVMIGCLVHYNRSYQNVAERIGLSLPKEVRKISRDTFCKIAHSIPSAEIKLHIIMMFNALKGESSLNVIAKIVPNLSKEALLQKKTLKAAW